MITKRSRIGMMLALAVAGVWASGAMAGETAKVGEKAPAFALKNCDGKEVKLSDFEGKIVVLEWINQKCPYSKAKHEDKTMQKTAEKFAGKDVIWLGIDSSHFAEADANKAYAGKMNIGYAILHDQDGKVGKAFGAKTTPHMFVIGKDGVLAYNGAIDNAAPGQEVKKVRNYVAEAVESLLKGSTVKVSSTKPYGCSVKYGAPAQGIK